jgi:hypothetical protein
LVVQKDPNKPHGQGGQGTRHAARLAIDIEFEKMTIAKAKVPIRKPPDYAHVDGMIRKFTIENSWKFVPNGEWITESESKKLSKYGDIVDQDVKKEGGYI